MQNFYNFLEGVSKPTGREILAVMEKYGFASSSLAYILSQLNRPTAAQIESWIFDEWPGEFDAAGSQKAEQASNEIARMWNQK